MNRPSYIVELDVLRAIAILMVLVHHLPTPTFGALHLKGGNYGVDLFFVLSGFLITRIRLREMSDGIGLKNFWIRRVGRIVPASTLCILIVVLIWGLDYHVWLAATYLSPFDVAVGRGELDTPVGHFWTLAVEEHFYLAWPTVLLSVRNKNPAYVLSVAVLFACQYMAVLLLRHSFPLNDILVVLNNQVFTRGWPLLFGGFLALNENWIDRAPVRSVYLCGIAAVLIACASAVVVSPVGRLIGVRPILPVLCQAMVVCGFVLCLGLAKASLFPMRYFDWLLPVGRVSYGLYLYHYPIFFLFSVRSNETNVSVISQVVAVISSMGVALLSYWCFEVYCIRMARRLSSAN